MQSEGSFLFLCVTFGPFVCCSRGLGSLYPVEYLSCGITYILVRVPFKVTEGFWHRQAHKYFTFTPT